MNRFDLTSREGVLPPLAYPWLLRQGVSPPLPLHLVSFGLPPTQPLPDVSCHTLSFFLVLPHSQTRNPFTPWRNW